MSYDQRERRFIIEERALLRTCYKAALTAAVFVSGTCDARATAAGHAARTGDPAK